MCVYPAYGLLLAHVALGALQSERGPWLVSVVAAGATCVGVLHIAAGWRELRQDKPILRPEHDGFVRVCNVDQIPEKRAFVACLSSERVAVFRYDGKISAISNVCRHQNGPLGEGRIVDGCVTCPWHGYQYAPETGASPPPFNDKVETYDVRVVDGAVLVNPTAHAPGTRVQPARILSRVKVSA